MEPETSHSARSERLATNWVKTQPILLAYLCAAVSDLSVAEDIAQEVAVATTRQYTDEQAERPFTPWVLGIARNQVLLHLRKKYRNRLIFDTDVLGQIEQAVCRAEPEAINRRTALATCLKKLSPKARRLIELRYESGVEPKQIAQALGSSVGSINVTLCRIRKALGECVNRRLQKESR